MSRIRTYLTVSSAAAAALYALPVFAAEAGEAKTGLPQLDLSHFPEQIFWLAVSFAVLYLLMSMVALPGVRKTIEGRQVVIAAELDAATSASEKAKTLMANYEKALDDARNQAMASVAEVKTLAAKEAVTRQADQQKQLMQRLQQAEGNIASARDAALADIRGAANDLASAIVDKVVGGKR